MNKIKDFTIQLIVELNTSLSNLDHFLDEEPDIELLAELLSGFVAYAKKHNGYKIPIEIEDKMLSKYTTDQLIKANNLANDIYNSNPSFYKVLN